MYESKETFFTAMQNVEQDETRSAEQKARKRTRLFSHGSILH